MDATTLFVGLILGSFGMAYFVYGKKQGHAMALISGIALMIFPYFISNIWLVLAIGAACIAAPWMIEL